MLFKKICIKNFRNFENVAIDISNKNIFFGLNDVGKTNLLCGIRYIFDNDIRKKGFIESDYYKKTVSVPIEIIISIDISDDSDEDNKKLRAGMKGNILSETEIIYIKLSAEFDSQTSTGNIVLYWGYDLNDLNEMDNRGYSFAIDKIFEVTYIDSYVDLYSLFKKNITSFIINDKEEDKKTIEKIESNVKKLNENISKLSGIKRFEENILPEYKKFKSDDIKVSIKSEFALKGFYSNLIPYLKTGNDDKEYPTSGDGRRKILTYSLYDLINSTKSESKIIIYIIEEPENHLHKSLQIALSKVLFNDATYNYLFVSTHSPYIVYEMDNTNLVRIFNEDRISAKSYLYSVPDDFQQFKKILNQKLAEAIFCSKVLLVEGPSEEVLFHHILSLKKPDYDIVGIYILSVNGIGFGKYNEILKKLGIEVVIKTDNDLRKSGKKYSVLGFCRCNKLSGRKILPEKQIESTDDAKPESKRTLFDSNIKIVQKLRTDYKIFLSRIDLENDLDEILHDKMIKYLDQEDPVKYLQELKHTRMYELVEKLTDNDCNDIYENTNFSVLKELS